MTLVARAWDAIEDRLSPEGTRRPTLIERMTVRRLPWAWVVRLNAWLAALGKIASAVYVGLIASFVVGYDVRPMVQGALNSGRRLEHVVALAFLLFTLLFLVARSVLGWARWRVQRELWRRDVERLSR